MLTDTSRSLWSARNKSKYLFSWSFHPYGGQTCNTGLCQHHAPNQYFPKGGTHTTSEMWNYVGGTQTNTIIVLHLCLLLYFTHSSWYWLSICDSIDNDFFLIEFNFKKLSSVKEKYLVNKYRLYIDLGKNVMVICILSKKQSKTKKKGNTVFT